jgi:hypothetical protein
MYHPAGFGEAGERSYPGRCNPHAWLKSGAIQPAKWYPFSRAEIFAPPSPGSHSPARPYAVSLLTDLLSSFTHLVQNQIEELVNRSVFGGSIEGDPAVLQ